jgi:hypothetical protein
MLNVTVLSVIMMSVVALFLASSFEELLTKNFKFSLNLKHFPSCTNKQLEFCFVFSEVKAEASLDGPMTLIIITLNIMTLSIMTLSIMTLSIMILSIMRLSIMTLTIMTIILIHSMILCIMTQSNDTV